MNLNPNYDVILYDSIGMSYDAATTSGVGGSEFEAIRLTKGLANFGLKVLLLNNLFDHDVRSSHGVTASNCWLSSIPIHCKTLILYRYSQLPSHIKFDNLLVYIHDMPGDSYNHLTQLFALYPNAKAVFVSDWQRQLYAKEFPSVVVPPLFPDEVDKYKNLSKLPGIYLYASAAMKGYEQTVMKWRELRNKYPLAQECELHVISAGYDEPDRNLVTEEDNVYFLGKLETNELLMCLATCEGIFYVNVWSELFPVTSAIADKLGARLHILCTNGLAGYASLTNSDLVTEDPNKFEQDFIHYLDHTYIAPKKKSYTNSTTLLRWLQLLEENQNGSI